ncbi:hypothetical protein [Agaribacterium sp. ZY112]|uniref:hypothetical protein n=1 Tax=Agaribacterium sp. ZY112 TaxID=3233574 RepID=UPI003524E58A
MSQLLNETLAQFSNKVAKTLTEGVTAAGDDPLQGSNRITESSSHDFTNYLFALEPLTRTTAGAAISRDEEDVFRAIIATVVSSSIPRVFTVTRLVREGDAGYNASGGYSSELWDRELDALYNSTVLAQKLFRRAFIRYCMSYVASSLRQVEIMRRPDYVTELAIEFGNNLTRAFNDIEWPPELPETSTVINTLSGDHNLWHQAIMSAISTIPRETDRNTELSKTQTYGTAEFTPFEPHTVNFGLQLVYRQVWLPKGIQTGDIIKTIPLGPGQKEKVTIKSVRRSQKKRSFESKKTVEQTSENVSSSRDSSEIVDEASSSSNWNVEVSAESSFGFGSAGMSASAGGEQAESSRSTKSNANEAMQKAADKLRTETKVIVESESEATDTFERTSEIQNDNEETAVTYVYSKLQKQYEIYTYLAEVNTVAYVAEHVISELDLSHEWFEKNATVIRNTLFDEALKKDLELVLSQPYFLADEPRSEMEYRDSRIAEIMDKIASKDLPNYSMAAGTPPDTISSVLAQYQSDKSDAYTRHEAYKSYKQSLQRLISHVAENALHYSKALWAAEASDLRMMRYRNILVPQNWTETNPVGNGYGRSDRNAPNMFVPVIDDKSPLVSLTDMINPAGPVGLAGNYLVFDLKESNTIKHIDAPLSLLRSNYTQKITHFESNGAFDFIALIKPNFAFPSQELAIKIRVLESTDDLQKLKLSIYSKSSSGALDHLNSETVVLSDDGRVEAKNISGLLLKDKKPSAHLPSDIVISGSSILTAGLEDPDFSSYRYQQYVTSYNNAEQIFTQSVIEELLNNYHDELSHIDLNNVIAISDLSIIDLAELVEIYLMHSFVKSNTRNVLLDTNNVVLSRVVDNASSLEPYKASHRQIDLLKTIEELKQDLSESQRYQRRLDQGDLQDPEIDSHIVVEGSDEIDINP